MTLTPGVANSPGIAGVRGAGVIKVAEQPCFARGALAEVAGNPIVAYATVQTWPEKFKGFRHFNGTLDIGITFQMHWTVL